MLLYDARAVHHWTSGRLSKKCVGVCSSAPVVELAFVEPGEGGTVSTDSQDAAVLVLI